MAFNPWIDTRITAVAQESFFLEFGYFCAWSHITFCAYLETMVLISDIIRSFLAKLFLNAQYFHRIVIHEHHLYNILPDHAFNSEYKQRIKRE
jgi:hypothetical protein